MVSGFAAYHSDQSILAGLPSEAHRIRRPTVEGHGPPALRTLPGPGLVAAEAPAGVGGVAASTPLVHEADVKSVER